MKKIICLAALTLMLLAVCTAALASTATFVADGETIATVEFEDDSRITPPDAPEKENAVFAGWTFEDGSEYKESKKLTGDQTITARYLTVYTFEAENTQLTDLPEEDLTADFGNKIGYGYSNNVGGLQLIQAEGDSGCNASNGYYISSLYYNGAYLEFVINSDRAVEDAQLTLRLSSEYYDMTISCSMFTVSVNGEALKFDDLDLTGAITDMSSLLKRPFTDYTVSREVRLNEGENVIRLEVTNSTKLGTTGTMNATAPMIDCIYVATDAELTWSPFANGLN